MSQLAFPFVCPFPGCIRLAAHAGVHFDGKWHHNDPSTWTPLKRQRKQP